MSGVESANYFRVISLVINIGSNLLRELFNKQIPPGKGITDFLRANRPKLEDLKRKRVLTAPQYDLVTAPSPDVMKFDISLLVVLLRNICTISPPAKGWNQLPPDTTDLSLAADLLRLRDVRNCITAHSPVALLATAEFDAIWQEVATILQRLATPADVANVTQLIADEKTRHLDPTTHREQQLVETFKKWHVEEIVSVQEQLTVMATSLASQESSLSSIQGQITEQAQQGLDYTNVETRLSAIHDMVAELGQEMQGIKANTTGLPEQRGQRSRSGSQGEEILATVKCMQVELTRMQTEQMRLLAVIEKQEQVPNRQRQLQSSPVMQSEVIYSREPVVRQETSKCISEQEIRKISKQVGMDWESLGTQLDYTYEQVGALKMNYPGRVGEAIFLMIKKWHDVVLSCNEDPRMLLAGAFSQCGNNLMAQKVVGKDLVTGPRLALAKVGNGAVRRSQQYNPSRPAPSRPPPSFPAPAAPTGQDFENRFTFHKVIEFPPPEPMSKTNKTYTSKSVKNSTNTCGVHPSQNEPINVGGSGSVNVFGGELNLSEVSIQSSTQSSSIPDISWLSMTNQLDARGPLNVAGHQSINVYGGKVTASKRLLVGSHGAPQVQQSAAGDSVLRGEIMDDTDAGVTGVKTMATTSAAATTTSMSYAGELKKQNDDTMSQTEVTMLTRDMTSVGALIASNSCGTCFRVGTKYIMTAWHVVRGIVDPAKRDSFDFSKLEDESVFVNFNEDPMQPCLHPFRVQQPCCFIDTDLDVAVLELKDTTTAPPPLPLCNTPPDLTHVSFVGFGHPNSSKKHLDPRCSVLSPTCDTVKAAHTWLLSKEGFIKRALKSQSKDEENLFNLGYYGYDDPRKVLFHCYMEHGSSGAPGFILDPYSQRTEVVSVLTNGSPACFWELPALAKSRIPPEYRIEMATRITAVEAALKKNPAYHSLRADIFS